MRNYSQLDQIAKSGKDFEGTANEKLYVNHMRTIMKKLMHGEMKPDEAKAWQKIERMYLLQEHFCDYVKANW